MFQEIDPLLIKQPGPYSKKRWFRDAETECDLFLWQDESDRLQRFQFWYQDAVIEWNTSSGIRTGHIDVLSGSFVYYQSKTYRLHQNLDQEILRGVMELLDKKVSASPAGMNQVREILYEIADRREAKTN
jgi:hypothetical protein